LTAGTWSWISRRVEADILRRELEHLEKIGETVRALIEELDAYIKGDVEGVINAYRRVFESEREADKVKESIIDELSSGVLHPIDREELIRLVLGSDDIAAHAKAAARRLLILSKLDSRPPQSVLESMRDIARIALEAVEKIASAIENLRRDPRKSIRLSHEVERLEEQADDIRLRTEEELVKWCNQGEPGDCLLSYRILESLEQSTDKCEDVGDIIRSIAILSS